MARGMAFLGGRLATAAGVTVTYTRGGVGVSVTAVPAEVLEEVAVTDPPGRAEHRRRDYLIRVEDLSAAGVSGEPRRGDRITETLNGAAQVFEVLPRSDEAAFRYSDAERTTYRIHTKPQG